MACSPDLTKPADKGYLFPWRSGQLLDIDPLNGRCHVGVDLEPDDIIFAFYSYIERDFIYFDVDVNPYSNPAVKDSVIRFFHKTGDPHRRIFHEIVNGAGAVTSTNVTALPLTVCSVIYKELGLTRGIESFFGSQPRARVSWPFIEH
jgi:hypothetical protein